jgi:hypothetical protein
VCAALVPFLLQRRFMVSHDDAGGERRSDCACRAKKGKGHAQTHTRDSPAACCGALLTPSVRVRRGRIGRGGNKFQPPKRPR